MNSSTQTKNRKMTLLASLMISILFISCSKNDPDSKMGVSSEQAIENFNSYFYKNGQVNATQLPTPIEGEWAVVAETSNRACEVFTDITGIEAPLKAEYEYVYNSTDGKCSIRLTGNTVPGNNAIYATMYVDISTSQDIDVIYIATQEYFEGTNDIDTPGIPVIL